MPISELLPPRVPVNRAVLEKLSDQELSEITRLSGVCLLSRGETGLLAESRGVLTDYRVPLRRRTPQSSAASVISSVIALAKSENRGEQTKAAERIRKR